MSDSFQVEVILTSLQDLKQGQVYISPKPSVSHSHTHHLCPLLVGLFFMYVYIS